MRDTLMGRQDRQNYGCVRCGHVSETKFGCCPNCRADGTARLTTLPARRRPLAHRGKPVSKIAAMENWMAKHNVMMPPPMAYGDSKPLISKIEKIAENNPITLGRDLNLPIDVTTQTLALLAKRGSGKTYTACVLIEEFARLGIATVAIDPAGGMWGLSKGPDGHGQGIDMHIFGGDHGESLSDEKGAEMALFVTEAKKPVLFDLSHMRRDGQCMFMVRFLEELYFRKGRDKTPMHLVIDEADLFAPQKTGGEQLTKKMLDAMEDIFRRGRQRGIGGTLATQRPSVIHKNVLSQTQVLIAMRLTAPQDGEAIDEWVRANGDEDRRLELRETLPALETGEAWFWSPGWGDIFKRVKIRKRRTFDSSFTPKVVLSEEAIAKTSVVEPETALPVTELDDRLDDEEEEIELDRDDDEDDDNEEIER